MAPTNTNRLEQCESDIGVIKNNMVTNEVLDAKLAGVMQKLTEKLTEQLTSTHTQLMEEIRLVGNKASQNVEDREVGILGSVGRPPMHHQYIGSSSRSGGSGGSSEREGQGCKYRRQEFPIFTGDNPDGWIIRAERYFLFYKLSEEEKLEAAVVGLDGDALLWYQWEHQRVPIRRWSELKALVGKGNLYEQWVSVEQVSTVEEYKRKFIQLAFPLVGVTEELILATFVKGLEGKLKGELRVIGPQSLEEALDMASRLDARNHTEFGPRSDVGPKTHSYPYKDIGPKITSDNPKPFSSFKPTNNQQNPNNYQPYPLTPYPSYTQRTTNPQNTHVTADRNLMRRITDREIQEKRAKGLCFQCDERCVVGHLCKRRELSVLMAHEDGEVGDEESYEEIAAEEPPVFPVSVSLNSVVGIDNPRTMKLGGKSRDYPWW